MTSRTTCWFCKRNLSDNQSNVKQEMGYITNVEDGAHETRTSYIQKFITIPRCAECAKAHADHGKFFTIRKLYIVGIAFIIFSFIYIYPPLEMFFFLVAFFGAFVGIVLEQHFKEKEKEKEMERKGIIPYHLMDNYPEIKDLILKGWVEIHD